MDLIKENSIIEAEKELTVFLEEWSQ